MDSALVLDIGGTKIAAGLVDPDGQLTYETRQPTPHSDDPEKVWAAAEHTDPFARPDSPQPDGMQRNAERLEDRGVGVAESVGHGDQARCRPRDQLAQRAVGRAVTGEAKGKTEMGVPGLALLAFLARDGGVDRHAQAGPRPRLDHACRFVTQHDRARQNGIADP